MENQTKDNKFSLTILGALGMMFLYYFILQFVIGIPFSIISEATYIKSHKFFEVGIDILGEIVLNIITVIFILKKNNSEGEENFKISYVGNFNFKLILITTCIMSSYYLWYHSSIGIVTSKIPMPKFIEEGFKNLTGNPYSLVISIMIWAPIFEEILMRGIILEGFLNKYKHWKAIVASAVIFGAIHLNITQFINATLIGIIFGVIYYRTRSLLLCIIGHMVNNTLAVLIDYTNFTLNLISFIVGITIFILATKAFIKYINKITDHKGIFEVESTLKNIS